MVNPTNRLLLGCASTNRPQTTSGLPEVTINAPASKVKETILAKSTGTLEQETEHTLVYTKRPRIAAGELARWRREVHLTPLKKHEFRTSVPCLMVMFLQAIVRARAG